MKTYPGRANDRIVYTEVGNTFVSVRQLARVIGRVPGVSAVRVRGLFQSTGDVRMWFDFLGVPMEMAEPFGDNSRYWIGPAAERDDPPDLSPIDDALRAYRPLLGMIIWVTLVAAWLVFELIESR